MAKENKELHKQLMEKSVCAFCGKKGCSNECQTEYDIRLLDIQINGYKLEDLEYMLRKTRDALEDVFEMLNEQMDENKMMEKAIKKRMRQKPVKKTG